jgi:predicted DNA-binding protein with PD1-like motif/glutaredoxin
MHPLPLHLEPGSDLRASLEQLAVEQNAAGFVLGVVGNLSRVAFQCPGRSQPSVLEGDLEIITLQGTLSPQGVHLHLSLSDSDCQVWGGHLEHGTVVLKGADLLVGFLAGAPEPEPEPAAAAHAAAMAEAMARAAAPAQAGLSAPAQADMAAPVPAASSPAVLQVAAPAAPPASDPHLQGDSRVEIAVLPGCPYSARAQRMLRTLGIAHRVHTVTSDDQRQALLEHTGINTLPLVFIDGACIGGYDALADLHLRGELDALR